MEIHADPEGNGRRVLTGHEEDIQSMLDAFPFYVLLVDSAHNILMANHALYASYQLKPEDVMGAFCPKLIHGTDEPFEGCPLEEAHSTGQGLERELYDEEHDLWILSGVYLTPFLTTDAKPVYLHTAMDITAKKKADEALTKLREGLEETVVNRTRELEKTNSKLKREIVERKRAEETIQRLAYYDALTGLPNRVNFNKILVKEMERAKENESRVGFAVLDLDGFKEVNDTAGHHAGDALLRLVGLRLKEAMRGKDSAARMGGDEFMFVFPDIGDGEDMDSICQRLLAVFAETFAVDGEQYRITASIGSALYPDDGADETTLLKLADRAMYRAKAEGKNCFRRVDPLDESVGVV